MNTYDLKQQLSDITLTTLSAEVRELSEAGAELTAIQYVLGGSILAEHLLRRSFIFLLFRLYGANIETLKGQLRRLTSMCSQFVSLYGDGPVSVLRTPARINILGEHIDYVSYLPTASLPFGSREHDMLMLYRGSSTDRVRGASTMEVYPPFSFTLGEGPPSSTSGNAEADWLSYLYEHGTPLPHWSNYVKGPAYFARIKGSVKALRGFDFLVTPRFRPAAAHPLPRRWSCWPALRC